MTRDLSAKMNYLLQILLIIILPFLANYFSKRYAFEKWLSPVLICYAIGILLSNLKIFPISENISRLFTEGTILLAIPLLLYSTDLKIWKKHTRSTILSFVLCVLSGVFSSFLVAYFFRNSLDNAWVYSGMIAGVYTGGIPNMQAIGMALNADQEVYVLVNAADIFCGGIYLLFLTSIAASIFGKFLPAYHFQKNTSSENEKKLEEKISAYTVIKAILWSILIIGIALGSSQLLLGKLSSSFIILILTTLSVLSTLTPITKHFQGAFQTGEYFLLMFCIAIGLVSDFGHVWENGTQVILFMGMILSLTVLLHLLLAYWFKIDRDTFMITSTAALYGPPFIGQIARVIDNRQLIFAGMATGLLGFALGNYIGIAAAFGIKFFLSGVG